MALLSFALRRLAVSLPSLLLILIGVFALLQLAPGDTVDALLAQMGGGDPVQTQQLRTFYGLDAPCGGAAWPLPVASWCSLTSVFPPFTASRWPM